MKETECFDTYLRLDLDDLAEQESPSSIYDIGGLRHFIIIKLENKEAFLKEITNNYKKMIEGLLEEEK